MTRPLFLHQDSINDVLVQKTLRVQMNAMNNEHGGRLEIDGFIAELKMSCSFSISCVLCIETARLDDKTIDVMSKFESDRWKGFCMRPSSIASMEISMSVIDEVLKSEHVT